MKNVLVRLYVLDSSFVHAVPLSTLLQVRCTQLVATRPFCPPSLGHSIPLFRAITNCTPQAEESNQLARAKADASDVALPLLRGQLLDAASSRAAVAELQAAASQRETARVSAALAEAKRRATAEVTGLRSEVNIGLTRV